MRVRRPAAGGEAVGGFDGLEEIGRGARSTVFRAREQATGRVVALKVLGSAGADGEGRRSFDTEVRALAALGSHPHIVTLFGATSTADGRPVLVLELCRGSLAQRLRVEGPLEPGEVVDVGIKVAGALESAHRAGYLHRDLKPHNLLVTGFGEPALADFGVALDRSGGDEGVLDFTTVHAPPEVLEGGPLTAAADVYGLASTLYQLASGRPPFPTMAGEAPAAVVLRILRDPVPALPGVPLALSDLLLGALGKDPATRPASAAGFAAALAAVAAAEGWVATPAVVVDLVPGDAPPAPPDLAPPAPPAPGSAPILRPPAARPAPAASGERRVATPIVARPQPQVGSPSTSAGTAAPGPSATGPTVQRAGGLGGGAVVPGEPVAARGPSSVPEAAAVAAGVPDVWTVEVWADPDALTLPPVT